jgi:hypothetical protein
MRYKYYDLRKRLLSHTGLVSAASQNLSSSLPFQAHYLRMTRWIQIVLYVVLALALLRFGVVWTLQGLNLWGGSFMTGSPRWLVIGVVLVIAGIALLVQSGLLLRRRARG